MKCNLDRETNGAATWDNVSWKKAYKIVRNLQTRIFKATQQGNYKKVRQLQKLLLRSHSNTLTSVRKVTQINQGKNTPGIDKQLALTKRERGKLVEALISLGNIWKPQPVRRIYIPKKMGIKNRWQRDKRSPNGGFWQNISDRTFVRYADDFVILTESEELAHKFREKIAKELHIRGLELSKEKTNITHLNDGFDFLGWNFRRYECTTRSSG